MTNRTLAALALLVAGLASLWFALSEPGVPPRPPLLPPATAASPDSLQLVFDGQSVTLHRASADSWSATAGPLDASSSRTVAAFARGLHDLDRGVTVDTGPADLRSYGLAPARTSVTLWSEGRATRLDLGNESPLGREVYASVRDGEASRAEVFLVSKGVVLLVEQVGRNVVTSVVARGDANRNGESR